MENLPCIGFFLLYELALSPIIFMKIMINIWVQSSKKMVLPLTLAWLILGPIVVFVVMIGLDVFTLFRILCTHQEEAHREKEKEEEDFR